MTRKYVLLKTDRKPRSDIGKERAKRVIKPDKNKLSLILYGETYVFRKLTDVKKRFENENIDHMSKTIQYILMNTYILRRLCNVLKGKEEPSLKTPEARQKYLSEMDLRIIPLK